jgi:hypothetical protein
VAPSTIVTTIAADRFKVILIVPFYRSLRSRSHASRSKLARAAIDTKFILVLNILCLCILGVINEQPTCIFGVGRYFPGRGNCRRRNDRQTPLAPSNRSNEPPLTLDAKTARASGGPMDNLELVSILEVAVFGLAIAQMLLIILTVRRERDIKELRDLVEEQRSRLGELKAWLAGRGASQSRRIASVNKSEAEPIAGVQKAESETPLREANQPRALEDELARAAKDLEWKQDVAARLQLGIKEQQTTTQPESAFKWFKDDPNEPPEMAEARRIVNGKTYLPLDQGSAESPATQPSTSNVEVERTLRAIRFLREEADKGLASLIPNPAANLKR